VYNGGRRRAATELIVLSIRWVSTLWRHVLRPALSGRASAHQLGSRGQKFSISRSNTRAPAASLQAVATHKTVVQRDSPRAEDPLSSW